MTLPDANGNPVVIRGRWFFAEHLPYFPDQTYIKSMVWNGMEPYEDGWGETKYIRWYNGDPPPTNLLPTANINCPIPAPVDTPCVIELEDGTDLLLEDGSDILEELCP
jgi:hypothetical protein